MLKNRLNKPYKKRCYNINDNMLTIARGNPQQYVDYCKRQPQQYVDYCRSNPNVEGVATTKDEMVAH